ncbi:MAG: CRISPR-associated helicase Cas3' [Microbacteriaceae bacterium]|nr:MAG: CRISPR-associated helicase Cas3' [Microbacteriaceae bacterium]
MERAPAGERAARGCEVSVTAHSVWAKIDREQSTSLPLVVHLGDSAAVAGMLWDDWLPPSVKSLIAGTFDGDLHQARTLVTWMAASHDLGKASPAFAIQARLAGAPWLVDGMIDCGLVFPLTPEGRERVPHSVAGQLILERWLREERGWSVSVARSYAVISGGHHGAPPDTDMLRDAQARPHLLGEGSAWLKTQRELADYTAIIGGADAYLVGWASRPLPRTIQALVTAIVIMSDWIASSTELFAHTDHRPSAERASDAWRKLQLPSTWHPVDATAGVDELFQGRFDFSDAAQARPVQRAAFDAAHALSEPGMLIIEAPMGEGKTEAAFMAAEVLAARFGLGGCVVALPTMATSDAMFARAYDWVGRLPDARGVGAVQTAFLAHGKARLNEAFHELAHVGRLGSMGDADQVMIDVSDAAVVAHEWLSGRKKGLLANFVVGTIDQILFGALKTKHVALRHLAFANKVVIIDEVHASDEYMAVYLRRILRWFGAYRVPVILLSATLTPEARHALAAAYTDPGPQASVTPVPLKDRRRRATPPQREPATARFPAVLAAEGYPIISTVAVSGEANVQTLPASTRSVRIQLERLGDDDDSLVALLRERLAEGGSAAVIRNTVRRAQHTAEILREVFPDSVALVHSRFIASDRMRMETELRGRLGPGAASSQRGRFSGQPLIVVGTQVLEQSLDIDVDLMVSDLAPMDLMLQRMGRLHRHDRSDRLPGVKNARFVMVGVEDWDAELPESVKGSQVIYGRYPLLRTLHVLGAGSELLSSVELPSDIAPLVRAAHSSDSVVDTLWADALAEAETEWRAGIREREARAQTFLLGSPDAPGGSLVDWLKAGAGNIDEESSEGQQQVRDSEDSIEVLVVQRVDGEIRALPWLKRHGGEVVPTDWPPDSPGLAYTIAASSIQLPPMYCKPWSIDRTIGVLEKNAFPGWQKSPLLKGQLVLVLDEELCADLGGGYRVRYDQFFGLLDVAAD